MICKRRKTKDNDNFKMLLKRLPFRLIINNVLVHFQMDMMYWFGQIPPFFEKNNPESFKRSFYHLYTEFVGDLLRVDLFRVVDFDKDFRVKRNTENDIVYLLYGRFILDPSKKLFNIFKARILIKYNEENTLVISSIPVEGISLSLGPKVKLDLQGKYVGKYKKYHVGGCPTTLYTGEAQTPSLKKIKKSNPLQKFWQNIEVYSQGGIENSKCRFYQWWFSLQQIDIRTSLENLSEFKNLKSLCAACNEDFGKNVDFSKLKYLEDLTLRFMPETLFVKTQIDIGNSLGNTLKTLEIYISNRRFRRDFVICDCPNLKTVKISRSTQMVQADALVNSVTVRNCPLTTFEVDGFSNVYVDQIRNKQLTIGGFDVDTFNLTNCSSFDSIGFNIAKSNVNVCNVNGIANMNVCGNNVKLFGCSTLYIVSIYAKTIKIDRCDQIHRCIIMNNSTFNEIAKPVGEIIISNTVDIRYLNVVTYFGITIKNCECIIHCIIYCQLSFCVNIKECVDFSLLRIALYGKNGGFEDSLSLKNTGDIKKMKGKMYFLIVLLANVSKIGHLCAEKNPNNFLNIFECRLKNVVCKKKEGVSPNLCAYVNQTHIEIEDCEFQSDALFFYKTLKAAKKYPNQKDLDILDKYKIKLSW